jgi:hypothetical protein
MSTERNFGNEPDVEGFKRRFWLGSMPCEEGEHEQPPKGMQD